MSNDMDYTKLVRKLAEGGVSVREIAKTTGLSTEQVEAYLGDRTPRETPDPTPPKRAPRGGDRPRSGTDYGRKAERDEDHGPPRTFGHAVRRSVGDVVEDVGGSTLRKMLKGGYSLGKKELWAAGARTLERNLGYTGEWLGSKIRARTGLSQIGQYARPPYEDADPKAVTARVAELDKAVSKILTKVEYGVRQSTSTIVRSIDRITSGLKADSYRAREDAYESGRAEQTEERKAGSASSPGLGGAAVAGVAGLGAGIAATTAADAAMPVPDLAEREERHETRRAASDKIEFKATTIEFEADEADFGGMQVPVAFAGGSGGKGGGGGPMVGDDEGDGWDPVGPGGRGVRRRRGGGDGSGPRGTGRGRGGEGGEEGYPQGGEGHYDRATGEPGEPGTYRPIRQITDDDIHDEVINTIAGEARLGDPESVDAVINNMFNRLGSPDYPSENLKDVARAPGQYEGYRRATPEQRAMIERRIRAIGSGAYPDITNGANEFRASSYVYGEGAGKTFAREAAAKNAPNLGGNVYLDRGYEKGPYAAYPEPRFPEPKEDRLKGKTRGITVAEEHRRGDRRLTDPNVAGPVNAGIMAADDIVDQGNLMLRNQVLEGPWPQAGATPGARMDQSRFGPPGAMVPQPPPPVTDYIQRTYTDLKAGESRPQVIDAGPEPKVKAIVDGKEQTEVDPEPPATSRKDHFDDFPGIADSGIPGLGK